MYVLGRQPVEKAVHNLAPSPEIVGRRTAPLCQPGHAALERVAVHVWEARNCDGMPFVGGHRRGVRLYVCDAPTGGFDTHVTSPPAWQKRSFEPEHRRRVASLNPPP